MNHRSRNKLDACESLDTDRQDRTLSALWKTSQELDGILSDLKKEVARKTKDAILEDGYDSDEGEHGERELRAELDSIYLPDQQENEVHAASKMATIQSFESQKSVSSTIDMEKQACPLLAPPECAPTPASAAAHVSRLVVDGDARSKDDGYPRDDECNDSSVHDLKSGLPVLTSDGFIPPVEDSSDPTSRKHEGAILPPVSSKISSRILCLRIVFAMVIIAVLMGISAVILADDGVEPATSSSTMASLEEELGPNSDILPSPTPVPSKSWLNGTADFDGLVEAPTVAPTLSPSLPNTPGPTVSPTASPSLARGSTTEATSEPTLSVSSQPSVSDGTGKKDPKKHWGINVRTLDNNRRKRLRGNMFQTTMALP
jgi:hypothetical protein